MVDVFLERDFDPAVSPADLRAGWLRGVDCFRLHGVQWRGSLLSLDGRKHDIACSQIDIGNADTAMGGRMKAGVPQANGTIASEAVMDVEHVATAVAYMASLPLDANVQFMTIMATKMPFVGRG